MGAETSLWGLNMKTTTITAEITSAHLNSLLMLRGLPATLACQCAFVFFWGLFLFWF